MPVLVSMLRGINMGPHHRIKMEDLRALYESLGMRDVQTYVQSGNVVFRTALRSPAAAAKRIEEAVEKRFGFSSAVLVRTASEFREVVARNPFAQRNGIEPSKLAVTFLATAPEPAARETIFAIKTDPEELRIEGREMYIYFPNGMARPKLPLARIERILNTPSTARNWNTVTQLLGMAEKLEAA